MQFHKVAFQAKQAYTLDQYFELEKSTNEKFEFSDGNVWSVSEASYIHNQIVMNLMTNIDSNLRRLDGQVLPSTMRIKVPEYPPYRYPDLTALCGDAEI